MPQGAIAIPLWDPDIPRIFGQQLKVLAVDLLVVAQSVSPAITDRVLGLPIPFNQPNQLIYSSK